MAERAEERVGSSPNSSAESARSQERQVSPETLEKVMEEMVKEMDGMRAELTQLRAEINTLQAERASTSGKARAEQINMRVPQVEAATQPAAAQTEQSAPAVAKAVQPRMERPVSTPATSKSAGAESVHQAKGVEQPVDRNETAASGADSAKAEKADAEPARSITPAEGYAGILDGIMQAEQSSADESADGATTETFNTGSRSGRPTADSVEVTVGRHERPAERSSRTEQQSKHVRTAESAFKSVESQAVLNPDLRNVQPAVSAEEAQARQTQSDLQMTIDRITEEEKKRRLSHDEVTTKVSCMMAQEKANMEGVQQEFERLTPPDQHFRTMGNPDDEITHKAERIKQMANQPPTTDAAELARGQKEVIKRVKRIGPIRRVLSKLDVNRQQYEADEQAGYANLPSYRQALKAHDELVKIYRRHNLGVDGGENPWTGRERDRADKLRDTVNRLGSEVLSRVRSGNYTDEQKAAINDKFQHRWAAVEGDIPSAVLRDGLYSEEVSLMDAPTDFRKRLGEIFGNAVERINERLGEKGQRVLRIGRIATVAGLGAAIAIASQANIVNAKEAGSESREAIEQTRNGSRRNKDDDTDAVKIYDTIAKANSAEDAAEDAGAVETEVSENEARQYDADNLPALDYHTWGTRNANGSYDCSHKITETSFTAPIDVSSAESIYNHVMDSCESNPEQLSIFASQLLDADQLSRNGFDGDINNFADYLANNNEQRASVLSLLSERLFDAESSVGYLRAGTYDNYGIARLQDGSFVLVKGRITVGENQVQVVVYTVKDADGAEHKIIIKADCDNVMIGVAESDIVTTTQISEPTTIDQGTPERTEITETENKDTPEETTDEEQPGDQEQPSDQEQPGDKDKDKDEDNEKPGDKDHGGGDEDKDKDKDEDNEKPGDKDHGGGDEDKDKEVPPAEKHITTVNEQGGLKEGEKQTASDSEKTEQQTPGGSTESTEQAEEALQQAQSEATEPERAQAERDQEAVMETVDSMASSTDTVTSNPTDIEVTHEAPTQAQGSVTTVGGATVTNNNNSQGTELESHQSETATDIQGGDLPQSYDEAHESASQSSQFETQDGQPGTPTTGEVTSGRVE